MEVDRIASLAERHRKVLRLYQQRLRIKEIARELALSEHSVNTYLTEAVQLLGAPGRRAAAEALLLAESPSSLSRYRFSAGPAPELSAQTIGQQPGEEVATVAANYLPLRPKDRSPNRLPVRFRLLWMTALLVALVGGVAVAVAMYTVYAKPMEDLLR